MLVTSVLLTLSPRHSTTRHHCSSCHPVLIAPYRDSVAVAPATNHVGEAREARVGDLNFDHNKSHCGVVYQFCDCVLDCLRTYLAKFR